MSAKNILNQKNILKSFKIIRSGEHTNTFPIQISPIIEGAIPILITLTIPSLNIIILVNIATVTTLSRGNPYLYSQYRRSVIVVDWTVSAVKSLSLN